MVTPLARSIRPGGKQYLTPSICLQSRRRLLTETAGVEFDGRPHILLQPIAFGTDPGPVAALRRGERSLHLFESVEQVDELLGVILGDGSNLGRGGIDGLPALILAEVTGSDRLGQGLGHRERRDNPADVRSGWCFGLWVGGKVSATTSMPACHARMAFEKA